MASWREVLANWINPLTPGPSPLRGEGEELGVTAKVDDSAGWASLTALPHERDWAEIQQLYDNALEAYRKNPIACAASEEV